MPSRSWRLLWLFVSLFALGWAPHSFGAPSAANVVMTVQLNAPATLDLRGFITGTGITGIAIATPPAHGEAGVNGTRVTYTPNRDFFGPDAFTYVAFGDTGASAPATVTVTIVGRPDPGRDPDVLGVVGARADAAQRFARAQIGNFQRRAESLHGRAHEADADTPGMPRTPTASNDTGFWIAGGTAFGHRDLADDARRSRFTTDGISAGVDRRFGERLALGIGLGYARDKADTGPDGSRLESEGKSIALYGSAHPGPRTFVDAVLGYASLDLDSQRRVPSIGDFAFSQGTADQWFASLSAGYEHRLEGLLISPYGRLDYARTRLKRASENGPGANALTYVEHTMPLFEGTLGVRAESQHGTRFGAVRPRARVEFSHAFENDPDAPVVYADGFGTRYTATPTGLKRNALLLGIGTDFLFGGGLRIGVDYHTRRASRFHTDQGVRIELSQALDGKGGLPQWFGASTMFEVPMRVEAAYVYDDNLTRARQAHDKLSDHVFSVDVNKGHIIPLSANARVVGSAFASGEELYRYKGLGRVSAGAQAELQYRATGDFDAITFGVLGRVAADYYDSPIRRGHRIAIALTARQSLTDRIEAFAALTASARYGRSAVFDLKDYGAKANLDYALGGPAGSLYVAGEFRKGDTVSSGRFSLDNIDIAEAFTPDEAFGPGFFSYRFDAKTWIGTLGYNRPLGPRDAIDVSWRRVQSTPDERPAWNVPGAWRYIDNQYSIIYLMRF